MAVTLDNRNPYWTIRRIYHVLINGIARSWYARLALDSHTAMFRNGGFTKSLNKWNMGNQWYNKWYNKCWVYQIIYFHPNFPNKNHPVLGYPPRQLGSWSQDWKTRKQWLKLPQDSKHDVIWLRIATIVIYIYYGSTMYYVYIYIYINTYPYIYII